jgi:hypothetical protein
MRQVPQDIAFVPEDKIDLEKFRKLLVDTWERFDPIRDRSEQALTTNFRKAARIYDLLRHRHKKHLKCQRAKKQNESLPAVWEPGVFSGCLNPRACIRSTRNGRVRPEKHCK